jgi:hypothetical protein
MASVPCRVECAQVPSQQHTAGEQESKPEHAENSMGNDHALIRREWDVVGSTARIGPRRVGSSRTTPARSGCSRQRLGQIKLDATIVQVLHQTRRLIIRSGIRSAEGENK